MVLTSETRTLPYVIRNFKDLVSSQATQGALYNNNENTHYETHHMIQILWIFQYRCCNTLSCISGEPGVDGDQGDNNNR